MSSDAMPCNKLPRQDSNLRPGDYQELWIANAAYQARRRRELETLASRTTSRNRWIDLIPPDDALQQLREICALVAHGESWNRGDSANA